MSEKLPTPGSQAAIDQGCTCPVMDNHSGAGIEVNGKILFFIDNTCPLHGHKQKFVVNPKPIPL